MCRVYFRVERKPSVNDTNLLPTGKFMEEHPDKGIKAEETLEDRRRPPDKPTRPSAFYIFEDEDCAKWYWAKTKVKTPDARLYRVKKVGEILHRGDMKLVDAIGETNDPAERKQHADDYWASVIGDKACVEVLVESATIIDEIVLTEKDRKDIWTKRGITRYDPSKERIEDLIFVQKRDE